MRSWTVYGVRPIELVVEAEELKVIADGKVAILFNPSGMAENIIAAIAITEHVVIVESKSEKK